MSRQDHDDNNIRLAAQLRLLKSRTGHSYETLGRRAGASRSALHRYCTGTIVPAEFRPLERFATACGASRDEVHELYRLWIIADAERGRRRTVGVKRSGALVRWMHIVFRRTRL